MSARRVREVERTYDVPDDLALPGLAGLAASAAAPEERLLEAVYWDTPDLRLRRARTTLRVRTGGPDAGWHLKVPSGPDREEHQVDGAPEDGVPDALRDQVRALVRSAPLEPLVRLRTRRTVRVLRSEDGRALVEVVDDRVEAERLREPGSPALAWREWEVELVAGPRELLDAVEERLLTAGARPAATPSKLGRAVPLPAPAERPWRREDVLTAGQVVQQHLRAQVDALLLRDAAAREGLPEGVHRARVTARRLRGLLRALRPLLDRGRTEPLRDGLRDLVDALGPARDAEVVHALLAGRLAAEPPELVLGPVRAVLDEVLAPRAQQGRARAAEALDDPAHLALLAALDDLAEDPPFTARAERPAAPELRRSLRRAHRRYRRAAAAVQTTEDLHRVRRRARELRHVAEAVRPALPRARRLVRALRDVQEELGPLQDAEVAQDVLLRVAAASARSGRNGFTAGRLHARAELEAARTVEDWAWLREELVPRKAVRWLR